MTASLVFWAAVALTVYITVGYPLLLRLSAGQSGPAVKKDFSFQPTVSAIIAVEEWVTRMLRMLGLGEGSPTDSNGERSIGWGFAPVIGQSQSADVRSLFTLSSFDDDFLLTQKH